MKSLFFFIVVVFCFTTIKAQTEMDYFPVIYTIDVDQDSISSSDSLIKKDEVQKQNNLRKLLLFEYSLWGTKKTYEGISSFAWENIIYYMLVYILGLQAKSLWKKNKKEFISGTSICIGLFVYNIVVSGLFYGLFISSSLSIGMLIVFLSIWLIVFMIAYSEIYGALLIVLSGYSLGWFMVILIIGQWIPILVGIGTFLTGMVMMYLYLLGKRYIKK